MKKVVSTLLLLSLLYFPFSCDETATCPDKVYFNKIDGLDAYFGVINPRFREVTTTSYDSAIFLIRISDLDRELIGSTGFGGFATAAYADSGCNFPSRLNHTLNEINITSSASVKADGNEYDAGTSLNSLFKGALVGVSPSDRTVDEVVTSVNTNPDRFSEQYHQTIIFRFNTIIDEALEQTLSFEFVFDDRTVTAVSEQVVVTTP